MSFLRHLRFVLLLTMAWLTGCASFPQHQVAQFAQTPATNQGYKPSTLVTVKEYMGENPGTELRAAEDALLPTVTSAVLGSGYVSPTPHQLGDKTDLQVEVSIHDVGEMGAAMISGFLSGLTLGIIPSEATDNYKVSVKISDANGKELTTVANEDSIHTWTGWVFLPMAANTPKIAVNETITNQVRVALKSAYDAGQLTITQATTPATTVAQP